MMKLRDFYHVTSLLVSHKLEDGFRLAYNVIEQQGNEFRMVKDQSGKKLEETRFYMIQEGEVIFEGNADEFRNSKDLYIQEFLD
jgi:hypothetical protein